MKRDKLLKGKAIAVLGLGVLAFSMLFAACGEKKVEDPKEVPNIVVEEPEQAESVETDPFAYTVEREDHSIYGDKEELLAEMYVDRVRFTSPSLTDLNSILEAQEAGLVEDFSNYDRENLMVDVENGILSEGSYYSYTAELSEVYHDERFISVQNLWTYFMGGVGNYGLNIANYDYVNYKRATIADVLNLSEEEAASYALDCLHIFLQENDLLEAYEEMGASAESYGAGDFQFFLSKDGLHLYFSQYEILYGAAGTIDFVIADADGTKSYDTSAAGTIEIGYGTKLADGSYFTTLAAPTDADFYASNGIGYVTLAIFDGSKLSTDGIWCEYGENGIGDIVTSEGIELPVAEEATFEASGGEANEMIARDAFADYLDTCAGSGLGLMIGVQNGVIIYIAVCS